MQLSDNCEEIHSSERLYAAGNGRTYEKQPQRELDLKLRYIAYNPMTRSKCEAYLRSGIENARSLICGHATVGDLGDGDSGRRDLFEFALKEALMVGHC